MVRAIFKDGLIQPIEDLPETWSEGQPLVIDAAEAPVAAEDIEAWSREIAAAAEKIPEEEHERFLAALEEEKKESKPGRQRTFGSARGLIKIADDFDEPLEDFREYVRESIDAGIRDADAGRVVSVEEVRSRFGLPPKP
jgi:hypothetical protein